MEKIRKAIIPVAGFGTRFLPATKAQPKEMLPLVDKPVIQYIVEEAVKGGIQEIIFVTGQNKRALEDHFDRNFELEYRLRQRKKEKELKEILRISYLAHYAYVRQKKPLGDGQALLCAENLVVDEPVAVLFGDDVIDSELPAIKQLINTYEKFRDPIIALMKVERKDVSKYGIAQGIEIEKGIWQIKELVEKPEPEEIKSNLAIVGRYILSPEVFKYLRKAQPSPDGEIRLIDGFKELIKEKPLYGLEFKGKRYDCGNKLQFLEANTIFALKHKELKKEFASFLKKLKGKI